MGSKKDTGKSAAMFYSVPQVEAFHLTECTEMSQLVEDVAGNEDNEDNKTEMAALGREVHFGETTTQGPNPSTPNVASATIGGLTSRSVHNVFKAMTCAPPQ